MKQLTKAYLQLGFFLFVLAGFSTFLGLMYINAEELFPLKRMFNADDLRTMMFMSATMGFGIMLVLAIVVEVSIDIVKLRKKK